MGHGMTRGKFIFRTLDDLLLHLGIEILKVGRIARHAHQQLTILHGVVQCIQERLVIGDVELHFHAPDRIRRRL